MHPGQTFAATLLRAQRGNEVAFAAIWRTCNPVLLRYLALRAPDAAADIASEVWVTVLRDLGTFRGGEAQFRAWLLEIARTRAKNWRRRQSRHPVVGLDDESLDEWRVALPDTEDVVVEALSAREAVTLVGQILPPLQAEAVILRVVAGLDVAETARVMGKRPGYVRVLTHRGLQSLARRLDSQSAGFVEECRRRTERKEPPHRPRAGA